jgi:hypothetical protein
MDHQSELKEPSIPVKEAYIFMHFNLFELAHSLFRETQSLSTKEKEIAEAWEATIFDFFNNCTLAPDAWAEYKHTYYKSFREYVVTILEKIKCSSRIDAKGGSVPLW